MIKSITKLRTLFFALLIISGMNTIAQAPATSFTAWAGSSGVDDGWGVGTDAIGNIYACGGFNGTVTFGAISLSTTGGRDMYLVKYSPTGTVLWAVKGGGSTASERGRAIAVTPSGDVFVTGYFNTSATFGGITVTSNGGYDVYLVKYNSSGVAQWVKGGIGSSTDYDEAFDVAVDASGNSFVIGYFEGTATFSTGVTLTSSGMSDVYIMKHNAAGVFQWVKKIGGTANDRAYGCSVDPSGNIGVTGYFTGTATFATGTSLTASGSADIFIAKYNGATGALMFAEKAGGSSYEEARGMDCDNNGNFYITGNYYGTATFGTGTGASSITSTTELYGSSPSQDIFTAKYGNTGVFSWVRSAGGGREAGGRDVACDDLGNVNTVGYFEGNIYFGTYYLQNVASNPSFAYEDPYAAQYDTSGNFNWAVHGGSGWHDAGYGITTDVWGNVIVTGTLNPDGVVRNWNGMAFAGATNSNNGDDMFVAKMGNLSGPPPLSMTINKTDISCYGLSDGSATVLAAGGGLVYSYLWSTGDTTTNINSLAAGTYYIIITDTANSIINDSIIIAEPSIISASYTSNQLQCYGYTNGNINLSTTGGVSPYSYLWSNGDTTEDASNVAAGYHSVIITDAHNCTITDSTEVLQPTQIIGTTYSTAETTALNNGTAWVIASGGSSGQYMYLWNDANSQNNDTAINLVAGDYKVTITDYNQCQDSAFVTVDYSSVGFGNTISDKNTINISPNPNNGSFSIEISENIEELVIIDVNGKVVFREQIFNNGIIQIETNLSKGMYYIQLKGKNTIFIKKLIVSN